jgi:phosphate:Na+ symporter
LIAAVIALILFPFTTPLLARAAGAFDGVTLLAAYHTAYNVVDVVVLLPAIDWFTRLVERLLPERGSPLTRGLDRAALTNPVVAVEAVRRTVALSIGALCELTIATLQAASVAGIWRVGIGRRRRASTSARIPVRRERAAGYDGRGASADKHPHALDHASRFADIAQEEGNPTVATDAAEDVRAHELCEEALRSAALAVSDVGAETALSAAAEPIASLATPSADSALAKAEKCASMLRELRRMHRRVTLSAVGTGMLTADEAMARVDAVQRLDALARHAWRSAAHLHGRGEPNAPPPVEGK